MGLPEVALLGYSPADVDGRRVLIGNRRLLAEADMDVAQLDAQAERLAAEAIAAQVGIDRGLAEVLPEDKSTEVRRLQDEGRLVGMVGDVNDAPALAQADVGFAMGTGTDVAIESADVTLISGELRGVVTAIASSKATMRNIRQNLFFAFAYSAAGIPVAEVGERGPTAVGEPS